MSDIIIIPLLPFKSREEIARSFGKSRAKEWEEQWDRKLNFAEAGISSWKNWAIRNNILLEVAESLPAPEECGYSGEQIELLRTLPPPVQRWLLPLAAARKHGDGTRIAMVDADTIISPRAPSIFEQNKSDVILTQTIFEQCKPDMILTRDRPEWNKWKANSLAAFAPMFPDIKFDKSLYFNAGVMVLNSLALPRTFLDFTLTRFTEFMSRIDGRVGTDQTPLNFILQRLMRDEGLSVSFLDPKWNARMDLMLTSVTPDRARWKKLARDIVLGNHISHFIKTKGLMPSVWRSLAQMP